MIILGLESSCDETAAAVVQSGSKVLSSEVYSQIETHRLFGGVVPEVAAREHLKIIDSIVNRALENAGLSLKEIDAIAVTQGPGLVGALLVAISYAKGLASASGKALIPVNHVHAHVHGAFLGLDKVFDDYPSLALVVSGGHTNLYHMSSPTQFDLLAHSIDDACGESFDKVAKLLDLGYPGGPVVEKLALNGTSTSFEMPKMIDDKSRLAFSYSGLKTHVVNTLRKQKSELSVETKANLCASFQEAALDQLVRKIKAACLIRSVKSIVIAGGVAANQRFRTMLKESTNLPCVFPGLAYCSDNAAMIAALGYHQYKAKSPLDLGDEGKLPATDWDAFSRYQYEGEGSGFGAS